MDSLTRSLLFLSSQQWLCAALPAVLCLLNTVLAVNAEIERL